VAHLNFSWSNLYTSIPGSASRETWAGPVTLVMSQHFLNQSKVIPFTENILLRKLNLQRIVTGTFSWLSGKDR
jgi:hypothetical protein